MQKVNSPVKHAGLFLEERYIIVITLQKRLRRLPPSAGGEAVEEGFKGELL